MPKSFWSDISGLIALVVVCSLSGCAGRAPAPEPTADQFKLAGANDAICLSVNGSLVDLEDDEPAQLTLATATQRALAASPEIQTALARAHTAWADAQQQRLLPNPVLNVAVRFPEGGGDEIIDAGLSADLLAVLTLPRRVSAADRRLRASTAQVLASVLDVLADVQEKFLAVQAADAELFILEERKKLVERLYQVARSRVEHGESSQLDAITVEADRSALEVEIAEKSAEQRQRRLELARLVGHPSGEADWTLPAWSAGSRVSGDERSLIVAALFQRPEVLAHRWELAALGDDLRSAQSAVFDGTEVGVEAEKDPEWSVGPALAVPVPIFDWGQARRDKAQAQLIEARHLLTQAQRQVVQEVRQAVAALKASEAALAKVHNELVPLQQRRREQADAAYRSGLADITTVLLAEQDAQATQSKLIELRRKSSLARVQLVRAVGGSGVLEQFAIENMPPSTTRGAE